MHISICNELAEKKRMSFAAEKVNRRVQFGDRIFPNLRTEFLDGICKDHVQVGEKLFYILGLSSLIIVRVHGIESMGPATSMRLTKSSGIGGNYTIVTVV